MPVQLFRDGKYEDVYQDFVYEPYRDADGNIIGVLAVTVDVTTQVIARRKLENSEQQVRSIIQSAPFPIAVYTGPEKRIAFANQSIMDVWGKGNDVVGKTYTEILPELENQQIFEQVTAVYETGVPFHARNQRVDIVVDDLLQPFYFNYSFTPVYDAEGKVYGVMNTAAEVTDLHRAKQKVEESEQNLRNTILQAPVAMCIYRGENYVIEIANNSMFEFWGASSSVVGKPLFEALPETKNQGFEEILINVRNTGAPFIANEMAASLRREGKVQDVYINFALEPIHETDGSISGIMAIAVDVTEQVRSRHKIEEIVAERTRELASANQSLQRSNAELEQFAYIASHDLQEPLRKVSTYSQMLKHSLGEIDERATSFLEKIDSSTNRMIRLVRDVLSYSQLSKEGKEFSRVNLNDVVEVIKSDYELLIEQKGAKIVHDELPVIEAIPLQMSQLLGNIISNALKFTKEDVPPVITIHCSLINKDENQVLLREDKDGLYYKIEIKDNGIGFEQEYADKIFNIFQRLHGKAEYSGTGIGLAMCKKIAQNHHGEIYATSRAGEGASFTIILPEKQ
jgi:PAS domain S-box-containing protein